MHVFPRAALPAKKHSFFAGAVFIASISTNTSCYADDASVAAIQKQVQNLQAQLATVQKVLAQQVSENKREHAAALARERERELQFEREHTRFSEGDDPPRWIKTVRKGFQRESHPYGPNITRAQNLPINGVGPLRPETTEAQQATPLGQRGRFHIGGVSIQLGGYIDTMAITRQRNEAADWVSNLGGTPLANNPQYYQREFRGTANGTRLSALIGGDISATSHAAAYVETDFGSSAATSNSVESSSYTLRMRLAYATYDNSRLGIHILAGQNWSMISPFKVGITARQESLPVNPDGQTNVGYAWQRQWQLRLVKDFYQHRLWAALSFEKPQATFGGTYPNSSNLNLNNPGELTLNPGAKYSDDIAPDIIAKIAFDPSWGHYEIFGMTRFINTNTLGRHPETHTAVSGAGGAAIILPLIGKKLQFQAQTLIGTGTGRYGSTLLPDAIVDSRGKPKLITETQIFLGLTYHPVPSVDLFVYAGSEQAEKRAYNINGQAYGYGNNSFVNSGCYALNTGTCSGNTRGVIETTIGAWWRFAHGSWGTMQAGGTWSHLQRNIFQGVGGAPQADNNIFMLDFRYLPFL